MTLAQLDAAAREPFVEAIGWVFEHSPWVAQRAWERRPFGSIDVLHEALTGVIAEATRDEQLALLRAHPDLGSRLSGGGPSGPPSPMTAASTQEQAGAGLDRLTPPELDRLVRLNSAYREKFGFPFLFAVKGSTPRQIIEAFDRRLPRTFDEELLEALRQVSRIARFRLNDFVRPDPQNGPA
jgi:2-oxo-4-hydroxy-4-carboxy-5-ureidoimidazoline decarboxylase